MNINDPAQRLRGTPTASSMGPPTGSSLGPPTGSSTTFSPRSATETRNGASAQPTIMNRAEKFEDEKRRIIESSFAKKDADGSTLESYITHIRIVEDAAFPSSPPPPTSAPENKKARIIVVAVRKSGRVRLHKARENTNGTFSVGKTWVLDDLTIIESFTNAIPTNVEEQQRKQWAGEVGFIVLIQKPYYWQANTAKEKDFFIGSLIKIYKKYTGGKLPQLYGFNAMEIEHFSGGSGSQPVTPQTPATRLETPTSGRVPSVPRGGMTPVTPQPDPRPSSAREPQPRQSQERSLSRADTPQSDSRPGSAREARPRPSQERSFRNANGQQPDPRPGSAKEPGPRVSEEHYFPKESLEDRRPRFPGRFPSASVESDPDAQGSRPQLRTGRSGSPASLTGPGDGSGPLQPHQETNLRKLAGNQSTESFRSGLEYGARKPPSPRSSLERQTKKYSSGSRAESPIRQRTDSPDKSQAPAVLNIGNLPTSQFLKDIIPERKRPPFGDPKQSSSQISVGSDTSNEYPSPSTSSGLRRDDMRPPSRSGNRSARGAFQMSTADLSEPSKDSSAETTSQHFPPVSDDNSLSLSRSGGNLASPAAIATPNSPMPPPEPSNEPKQDVVHRPGLGPMIKKKSNKEIAATFRKAATTYNAFKPRPGGAAEKLRSEKEKSMNEPDGISGVVPAPFMLRGMSQDSIGSPQPGETPKNHSFFPEPSKEVPTVRIITPPSLSPKIFESVPETAGPDNTLPSPPSVQTPIKAQEDRRRKQRPDHSTKYARALGINPSLLEGRTFEIETALDEFGWGEMGGEKKLFEDLQADIRKDLARVEAGSWLSTIEHNDERVATVGKMLDKVVSECEELDCLLTLYNVELGTLSEDVAYIEAQSQGLQVQTANQKLLQAELSNLLGTISISTSDLKALKDASLTKPQGIQLVETILCQLYAAMLTIDPKLGQNGNRPDSANQLNVDRRNSSVFAGNEISSMRAVREKKQGYHNESIQFIQRLKQHMSVKYRETEVQILDALERNRSNNSTKASNKLDLQLREKPKRDLWLYSPLMLFARGIELFEWEEMMRTYEMSAKKPYQEEFKENISSWKRMARRPAGEEQDVLFTTQEKESESIVGRKLTVKRSKIVRPEGSGRYSNGDRPADGKVNAYEAFAGALNEMAQAIFIEQNFIVDLFHVNSLETADFTDVVSAVAPEARKSGNLTDKKLFDPDRTMAKRVVSAMDEIYSFWPSDMQNLVDWVVKQDTLQCVGVLYAIEVKTSELEDSNQEFLIQTLSKVHDRLSTVFARFIEDQIRGIEDTKVKIKKRKGVIAFIKTFPSFTLAVENMLPPPLITDPPQIRTTINDAYDHINKAMFESLKFIAKESPSATQASSQPIHHQGPTGDPEDKEALNHHILLIENMNYYIEELPARPNPTLHHWKSRASVEFAEHLSLYLDAVLRRPLGKLLDFLESTEALLLANATNPSAIATRQSHSKGTFRKLLGVYDAKEVRRGAETLRKRVEKHFGGEGGVEGSPLVGKVLRECEGRYGGVGERAGRIAREVYGGEVEVEWRREDVAAAFRR